MEYEIESEPAIYWAENSAGYLIRHPQEIAEGIYLEGLEETIINTEKN
jgi:hypothetical protein